MSIGLGNGSSRASVFRGASKGRNTGNSIALQRTLVLEKFLEALKVLLGGEIHEAKLDELGHAKAGPKAVVELCVSHADVAS